MRNITKLWKFLSSFGLLNVVLALFLLGLADESLSMNHELVIILCTITITSVGIYYLGNIIKDLLNSNTQTIKEKYLSSLRTKQDELREIRTNSERLNSYLKK